MRNCPSKKSFRSGQIVLIILLIVAVVLTVGLSTISSSITDVRISRQTEDAARAFYVAESALEENFLLPRSAVSGNISGIDYQVVTVEQGGAEFVFPETTDPDSPKTIWLLGHDTDGSLQLNPQFTGKITLFWGEGTTSENIALAATVVYKETGIYKIKRYNFDPLRRGNFAQANTGQFSVKGVTLKFSSSEINITNGVLIKVTTYFNNSPAPIGAKVSGSGSLPAQGYCFESSATVVESGITRKIRQCKFWQDIPGIFYWGLFSGGSLEKNR